MADESEQQVWCQECNCYLFSNDRGPNSPETILVSCPCTKDPLGKCTGIRKGVDRPSIKSIQKVW